VSLLFGEETRSGESTDWDTMASFPHVPESEATHLGPVFSALRHIVDYTCTLPMDFFRYGANKAKVEVEPPELIQRVAARSSLATWVGQLAYATVTRGNAVGLVNVWGAQEARPLDVTWSGDWSGGEDGTPWFVDGLARSPALVVHVPWLVPPGKVLGLSPIEHFAAMARAGLSAQEYADVKRGGGLPPAHLKNTAKVLDANQAAVIRDRAVTSFASGKPFVSGNDWDLSVMTIPPSHAQFIETLKLSATQIAAIYGIDPREIGGESANSQTYSNDESRALNRAHNMRPYLVRFERAISRLLPDQISMRFNVDATIRTDMKTRFEIYEIERRLGTRNINEIRVLEDREPIGSVGDAYVTPAQPVPTNREA